MTQRNVLFVTWDGPQVSYLEGLFLPIFARLNTEGFRFHVLQFTWDAHSGGVASACAAVGISYRRVDIWRGAGAAGRLFSAVLGARHVRRAIRDFSIDLVLPRSHMPALSAMVAGGGLHTSLIFDADGLPADERVDFGGLSSNGPLYKLLRRIEVEAVRRAEVVLVRTRRASEILAERSGAKAEKFHVVTNGRDASMFRPAKLNERGSTRAELGLGAEVPLLAYAGSVGAQYCFPMMLELAAKVRLVRSDVRLLMLTGSPETARKEIASFGDRAEMWCVVRKVSPDEMPRFLGAADVGIAFRQQTFSMQAVAPIKIGEYALCGLPIVGTPGIGDTDWLIKRGVFFPTRPDRPEDIVAASQWILDVALPLRAEISVTARECALGLFSVEASVKHYLDALNTITRHHRPIRQCSRKL